MVKILHLATRLRTGGVSTHLLNLVGSMRENGIESEILTGGGECVDLFREFNYKVHESPINVKSELHPQVYRTLPSVLKIIHESKIDILHAHTRVTQVLAYWAHVLTGIPFFTTCHGFYKKRLGRRILPAWGQRVIAISPAVADHLRDYFNVEESRICRINNAVDVNALRNSCGRFTPENVRADYGFSSDHFVIGTTSRMVAEKGHACLIRAVALLKEKLPQIRLLMVGDGREKKSLLSLVHKLEIRNQVIFENSMQDVTKAIAAMDAFAFPVLWKEGFGLSVIEAMACAKPVIASTAWSLTSIAKKRGAGMFIEPRNAHAWAQSITALVENNNLRQKIALRGQAMVEELFTTEKMAASMVDLYRKAAKESRYAGSYAHHFSMSR